MSHTLGAAWEVYVEGLEAGGSSHQGSVPERHVPSQGVPGDRRRHYQGHPPGEGKALEGRNGVSGHAFWSPALATEAGKQ